MVSTLELQIRALWPFVLESHTVTRMLPGDILAAVLNPRSCSPGLSLSQQVGTGKTVAGQWSETQYIVASNNKQTKEGKRSPKTRSLGECGRAHLCCGPSYWGAEAGGSQVCCQPGHTWNETLYEVQNYKQKNQEYCASDRELA